MNRMLREGSPSIVFVLALAAFALILSHREARGQARQPTAKATTIPAGNAENGKKIYRSYGCWQCHGYDGHGGGGPKLGPDPIPFSIFSEFTRRPPNQMPAYTSKVLSDKEMADIYAFVQTLPKPPDPKSVPLLNDSGGARATVPPGEVAGGVGGRVFR